jgi:hypothetical protein
LDDEFILSNDVVTQLLLKREYVLITLALGLLKELFVGSVGDEPALNFSS